MMVEVVKEFGNKLPSLINELKSNHTAAKEDADMIFSTVHRCKGMEYDQVTLLNDFINEEKLKKYIAQYGGEKMNERDKNRLAEEINILYVAATRAKSKLKIPPEINPLQSVELAAQPLSVAPSNKRYQRKGYPDDWDLYEETFTPKNTKSSVTNSGNHGKRWTHEEEDEAAALFGNGAALKDIAKQLRRGINGVKMKLFSMGLLEDHSPF